MNNPFALSWILPQPANFRARVSALLQAESPDAAEIHRLAAFDLDLTGLDALRKFVKAKREWLAGKAGLTPFRLGIVSSHTVDYLAQALPGTALRHGMVLDVAMAEFGQAAQQLLDPGSEFGRAHLDAVLIALDYRALGLSEARLTSKDADSAVDAAVSYVAGLADGVRDTIGAICVLQTLVPPADSLFGNYDGRFPGAVRSMIERFNHRLLFEVLSDTDLVVDTASLAACAGLDAWNDARDWHKAKLPAAMDATPLYAEHVCRVLGAARGKSRKCLVMDLDNTLWGGVIGDDGLNGIRLGQGSSTGEAHLALQRYALALRQRGIVLAVCSKNDEANARLPFREHPEMLIREEHIAVFVANWDDKANNIREIAATLNIGIDAIVFLDDNPVERGLVRDILPEVAVPELTDDPADYAGILSRAGYFEAIGLSGEDLKRADYYGANAERASLKKIGNLEDYLASLEMVATIAPFDAVGRVRIAQLVNKSNQFNLTTRRYSENDIARFEADLSKFCLQIRLADRFGDNGMISVVIFDCEDFEWRCDTWLMSCRVLGRRVEELVLAHVAAAARNAGALRLTGTYLPTKKNSLVVDHFAKLGFTKTSDLPDGGTEWALDIAAYQPPDLPIAIVLESNIAESAPQPQSV
jgi:FkbH-like protein